MILWHLRSYAHHDTHRGEVLGPDSTVTARCGATFVPLLTVQGTPLDSDQLCPVCRDARADR